MDKRPWYRVLLEDIGVRGILLFLLLLAVFIFMTFVLPIMEANL